MTEINDIEEKLHKKRIRIILSLYGKHNSLHLSRDTIRILGFPKYISIRVKDTNYVAIIPSEAKEPMSFLVPKNLFEGKNGQFRITSKGFVTTILDANKLDKEKSYLINGNYSQKENAVFFNMKNYRTIINSKEENSMLQAE